MVTVDSNGPELVTLSEQIAKGKVLLLFVPMAFTGACTDEFCSLSKDLAAYKELDCTVLGISGDSPFAQQEWAQKEGIEFALLSDYEHEVAKAYGIAYETFLPEKNLIMGGVAKRSAFLLDQDGVVQYAQVEDDPHNLPDFDAIKAKLAELG